MKNSFIIKGMVAFLLILAVTGAGNRAYAEVKSFKIADLTWINDGGTAAVSVNNEFCYVKIAGTGNMASVLNPIAGLNFRTKATGFGTLSTSQYKVLSFKFDEQFNLKKYVDQFSQISIKLECKQANGNTFTKELYYRQNGQNQDGIVYDATSNSFVIDFQKGGFPIEDGLEIKTLWLYFLDKSSSFLSEGYWGEWDKYQFRLQTIKAAPSMDDIYADNSDIVYTPDSTRLLDETIAQSSTILSNAKVGSATGQYDQEALNTFNLAINDAELAKSSAKTQSDLDFALYTLNLAVRKFNAAQHLILYDDLTNATSLPAGQLYYIKSGDKYLSCADTEKGASTLEDQVPGGLLNYQVWRIKKSNSNPPRYTISSVLKNSTDTIQGYFLNDNAFAWKGANGNYTDWVIFGNGSNVTLWNNASRCVEVTLNKDGIKDTMIKNVSERNYSYQLIPYTGIEGQVADITPLSTAIDNASSLLVGVAEHEYYNSQKSELLSAIDAAKSVVLAGNANQATIDKYLSILARTSSNFKTALDFINSANSIPSTILFKSSTVGYMSSGMKIEAAGNLGYTSNGSYALIVLKPEVTGNYTMSYLAATENPNASIVTTITDSIGLMNDYTNLTASIDTFAVFKGGWSSWTGDTINVRLTGGKTYYLRFNWIGSGSNVKEMKFTVEGVVSYILLKNAITEADSLLKKATGIQYLTSKVAELNLQLAASSDLVLTDTASQVTVDAYAFELLKTTADLNTMYLNYMKINEKGVHVPASIPFNSETVPLMSSGMQIENAGNFGYTDNEAYALITLIADTTCMYRMTYKACSPNNGACIVTTITDSVGKALDFKNIADNNHLFNVTIRDWSTWFNDTIEVYLERNSKYFLRFNFHNAGSNLKDLKFEAVRKVEDAVDKNSITDICILSAQNELKISGLVKGSKISVYGIDGVLISSQKAENQLVTIPMKKGIYIVSVNTVDKQLVRKVMVK